MFKLKNILLIILGTGIFSFGINYLIIPYELFEGGVTGITLITYYLFDIPVSYMNIILNIPLFIIGWRTLGKRSLVYSLLGTVSVSAWLSIFSHIHFTINLQNDLVLVVIISGVILGLGLGITFNAGGTTGGTDIIARIVNKYFGLSMGKVMLAVDFLVILMTLIVFQNLRTTTYTLLFVFIATRVIDFVVEGGYGGKGFTIISSKYNEIAELIDKELNRGVTFIHTQGYYTKHENKIIYCVVARNEIQQMKRLINKVDPHAFVTVVDTHDVMGEGFTLDQNKQPLNHD